MSQRSIHLKDHSSASSLSRRCFVKVTGAGAVVSGLSRLPGSSLSALDKIAPDQNRVLVVIQLTGGNDGLNTVVPFRSDEYRKARPTLAIPESDVLKLDSELGLHPSLRGLADLFEDDQLRIIQGVGYEKPNRSHFESMDIWHSCNRETERNHGWLGNYVDHLVAQKSPSLDLAALHLGRNKQPLALRSLDNPVASVRELDEFRLVSNRRADFQKLIEELNRPENKMAAEVSAAASSNRRMQPTAQNDLLSFVQSSTSTALDASKQVAKAQKDYKSTTSYPSSELADKLSVIARLIDSGLKTHIYYVELDGFDTHARQADAHAVLLQQWGDAMHSFVQDLNEHGHGERVCVLTFSEFGRRVAENASNGTDHGAAAPVFLAGGGVGSGLTADLPNLTDLDDGDINFSVDFRRIYASILEQWFQTDSQSILGKQWPALPLFG